ncbi:hypothetical protein Tco_1493944 [Tanacetum coccineum]
MIQKNKNANRMDLEKNVSSIGVNEGCSVNGNIEKVDCGIEEVRGENSLRKEQSDQNERVMEKRINSLFDGHERSFEHNTEENNGVFGVAAKEVYNISVDNCGKPDSPVQNDNDNNVETETNRDTLMKSANGAKQSNSISALASSLGKLLLMDFMTAKMCHKGIGSLEYARVVCKEGFIEVNGKVGDQNQAKSNDNVKGYRGDKQDRNAGFMMQGKRRMFNKENNNNGIPPNVRSNISSFRQNSDVNRINSHEPRHEYRRKQGDAEINDKSNDASNKDNNRWLVKDKVVEELRKTTNKFSALDSLPEDNDQELRMLKDRMFVDKYLNKKIQPTPNEAMSWSKDMAKYFKDKWEEDRQKKMEEDNGNDVFEDVCSDFSGIAKTMEDNEIDGIEGRVLNDDSYRV